MIMKMNPCVMLFVILVIGSCNSPEKDSVLPEKGELAIFVYLYGDENICSCLFETFTCEKFIQMGIDVTIVKGGNLETVDSFLKENSGILCQADVAPYIDKKGVVLNAFGLVPGSYLMVIDENQGPIYIQRLAADLNLSRILNQVLNVF